MRIRGMVSGLVTLILALSVAVCAGEAEEILDATGIKGGLIVHVGCGDGKLTAALAVGGVSTRRDAAGRGRPAHSSFLVHGLDADAANVEKARAHVQSLGLYGPVAIDRLTGGRLPYVEGLANLVVAENLGNVPMAEVMRVLCPNGVAYVKQNGQR